MGKYLLRRKFRRVLIDVQTQYDLIYNKNNDLTVFLQNVRRLIAWSRVYNIPVISMASSYGEKDNPDHLCLEGKPCQQKIKYTLLPIRKTFCMESSTDIPEDILRKYNQIIFNISEKDPFGLPRADRLLTNINADEFVVFGIGLNDVIKFTVLGLLKRGKKVIVVSDAIDFSETDEEYEMTARKLSAKGAKYVETASLAGISRLNCQANKAKNCPDIVIAKSI